MALSVSQLELTLARIHEWTRGADQKISVLVTIHGLLSTLGLPTFLTWLFSNLSQLSGFCVLLYCAALIAEIIGFGKALQALTPRLRFEGAKKSVTYFGHIAKLTFEEYHLRVSEIGDGEYRDDVISQIHTCAVIASEKYRLLFHSVLALVLALLLALGGYIAQLSQ